MAQPAQVGPYITNLNIEERRKEIRTQMIEQGVGGIFGLGQTMFAYEEARRAENERQAKVMGDVVKLYGDDPPPAVMNAYGESVEKAMGRKIFARDTSGNIAGPSPDTLLTPEERQLKRAHPEQWNQYLAQKLGMSLTPKDQATLDDHAKDREVTLRHDHAMEMLDWAKYGALEEEVGIKREEMRIKKYETMKTGGRKPSALDVPSQYTLGTDGWPRKAQPGEPRMTRGDILNWDGVNSRLVARDKDNRDQRKMKMALQGDERDIKKIMEVSRVNFKSLQAAGMDPKVYMRGILMTSFGHLYARRGLPMPQPDPGILGNAAKLRDWMLGQMSQVWAADAQDPVLKSVPMHGAPMGSQETDGSLANKFLNDQETGGE